ncbi:GGDEF domain-containing protein [Flocculibacter collagenilyticus]|uniref:GGDEF domain-containing protein n=1 Tax=Flocculibacter collagenilyticus TaxID=2744479 RepID=UPI0018F28258|nr:diguanylate cyclase [Flocculibacter collagenilyticus]
MTNKDEGLQLQQRADHDFVKRSIPGVIIFIIAWPIIAGSTGFYKTAPVLSFYFALLLIIPGILRLVHLFTTRFWYPKNPDSWRLTLAILALGHSAIWGIIFYITLTDARFESIQQAMLILLIAISCGATSSLIPKPRLTLAYITILMLPSFIAGFYDSTDAFLSPMLFGIWCYLLIIGHRYSEEYRRAFYTEYQLQQRQEELEKLTITDALTQLYNRSHFDTTLALQWQYGIRHQTDLSLLLIDLDHFKRVNDQYGHLVGDRCLRHAADIIKQTAKRSTDTIARYGGEEFAIILPNCSEQNAYALAESIREELARAPFTVDGVELNLTTSIGVACIVPNQTISSDKLIKNADIALYKAKDTGRNNVQLYQPSLDNLKRNTV